MLRSGALLTEMRWKKIASWLPPPRKNRRGGRPWMAGARPHSESCAHDR